MKRYLGGLLIAATLVTFLLLRVDRASLARILANADWTLLCCAMALKVTAIKLRSQRWGRAITAGSGARADHRIFSATVVGLAGNIVLPARMGELARMRLLTRHNDVPVGFMASAAAVAYLLDAVLLSLVFAGFSKSLLGPEFASRATVVTAATLIVAAIAALAGRLYRQGRPAVLRQWIQRESPAWVAQMLAHHTRGLLEGFAVLTQKRHLRPLIATTLLIVSCEVIAVHLGLKAVGIHVGWAVAVILVVALQLSYAIPLTPGNLGPHQVVCVILLAAFGVSMEEALGFSIAYQGVAHATVLAMAGVVLAQEYFGAVPLRCSPAPSSDSA